MEEGIFLLKVGGGDWGTLFRSSFGKVVDGSPNDIVLSDEEQITYVVLTADKGKTHSWFLLRETVLVEHGLSPVSEKGKDLFYLF